MKKIYGNINKLDIRPTYALITICVIADDSTFPDELEKNIRLGYCSVQMEKEHILRGTG